MTDWLDEAQALTQQLNEAAIKVAQAQLGGEGSDDCIDCDQPIPPARRQALPSAKRCVACQGIQEGRHA